MKYQVGGQDGRVISVIKQGSPANFPGFYLLSFLFSLSPRFNWYSLPFTLFLLIGLVGCGGFTPKASKPNDASSTSGKDSNLTFFGMSLEQFDDTGKPIWKVRAKQAQYTKEKQIAQAENPEGELYQDGKIVYRIKAERADIEQNGKQLLLKGKILAIDPAHDIILQGNELEWRPQEDLLIVRNNLNATHKQLQAIAKEAKVKTREQLMEFFGNVVAKSIEPPLQMQTEHLKWQIKENKLISDRLTQIQRYKNNQITDRAKGDAVEVNLKTNIVTMKPNASLDLLDPRMQIVSNSITWNMKTEIVNTNSPVRIFNLTQRVVVNANRGELRTQQKTAYFSGNVNAVGQRRQSLQSRTLTWYLDKKLLEAQGNVIYRQADPPLNFTGETAQGDLQTENIVVKGGSSSGRVVTEIIPR